MTSLPLEADLPRALPRDLAACILPGERVVLAVKPGIPSIVLRRLGAFSMILAVAAATAWLAMYVRLPVSAFEALMLGLSAFAVLAFWAHLDWATRDFVLTDRRIISAGGIIRRLTVESPIQAIQQVVIYQSIRERLFGLGTVGVSTPADAGAPSVVWSMVSVPDQVVARIRLEMARAAAAEPPRPSPRQQSAMHGADATSRAALPVIGLAGGIGAGKSTVAGILARLGCLVVDSDARAKAALDRPDVREQLKQWWGPDILLRSADGGEPRVDRAKVAKIIFADPDQRTRLEALVHPIVRQDRATAAREGAAAGAKAVIVDAPLLFEAGLDSECDAVIFVDAPREARLKRVRDNRGWSAEELDRREAAQLALQTKRAKADYVLVNDGPIADLQTRIAGILNDILARRRA